MHSEQQQTWSCHVLYWEQQHTQSCQALVTVAFLVLSCTGICCTPAAVMGTGAYLVLLFTWNRRTEDQKNTDAVSTLEQQHTWCCHAQGTVAYLVLSCTGNSSIPGAFMHWEQQHTWCCHALGTVCSCVAKRTGALSWKLIHIFRFKCTVSVPVHISISCTLDK